MEMSDSLHVPVEDLGHGARRFIWDMPYGRVLIDVLADGQVLVNGAAVGRSGGVRAVVDRAALGRAEVGRVGVSHVEVSHVEVSHVEVRHVEVRHVEVRHVEADRVEADRVEVVHPAGPQAGPMVTPGAPTGDSAWDPQ